MKRFTVDRMRLETELLEICPETIPWGAVEPWETRAWANHGKTLEALNAAGGLEPYELVALLTDRPLFGKQARPMSTAEAITRLTLLLSLIYISEPLRGELEPEDRELLEGNGEIYDRLGVGAQAQASAAPPDCYKCTHRGILPGDAHSRCTHPIANVGLSTDSIAAMGEAYMGKAAAGVAALGVKGGGQTWPANFDPARLEACNGFTPKGGAGE